MAGVRILCNQIIPVTDWNHDYVTVKSKLESKSPLPTLASFDLLNPLDNSGHGYTVKPNGGQIRDWGLHYPNGAKPSETNLVKTGQGAVSFIVAFKLDAINRYINIISNRLNSAGFNFYYSGGFYMSYIYPSGTPGTIAAAGVINAEVGKWYVAVGVFDPVNKTASVRISDAGLQYGTIGSGFPGNTSLDAAVSIGGDPGGLTTSSMHGDIAFNAYYDGAFTADQRDAMVSVGTDILNERGLV
ncbi:LamG-like jellyroll fold domain-containing protein [Klebsiella michiganensis]|uniref:LamG-like jellyroll fold domain-containing protein n=1 Tax=Klebsiella michiganensis TaxID=1134687 RepID=UPI0040402866